MGTRVAGALVLVVPVLACGATAPGVTSARACTPGSVVSSWSVRRQAEQTVVVPVDETEVTAVSAEVAAGAGGVILFGSKAPTNLPAALRTLTALAPHGIAPLVMTDEEGGAIQRMPNLVGAMPSARTMGATMTPAQIAALATKVGHRMSKVGVGMNLAPVLDLDDGPGPDRAHPIGTRSFSISAKTTTADGLAFARGMRAAGVTPVVKHFPGLGLATANTDLAPAWTKPWPYLRSHGLQPFTAAAAAGMPAVMVANARVPGLTDVPASLSARVVRVELRRRLHFHGLVLTDSLSAGAIAAAGYHVPAASVQALRAGADMVLYGADPAVVSGRTTRVVRAIVRAVTAGTLSRTRLRAAVVHVIRAKHVRLCA